MKRSSLQPTSHAEMSEFRWRQSSVTCGMRKELLRQRRNLQRHCPQIASFLDVFASLTPTKAKAIQQMMLKAVHA